MRILSLSSLKGGTGKTALAAHLGVALTQENLRCLIVDFDPQNALGCWFGMELGERLGICRTGLNAVELLHFQRKSRAEAPYLPFGATTEKELAQLEAVLERDADWLRRRLTEVAASEYDIVVLDTPSGNNVFSRQALAASDVAVVVLLPDSSSYATLPAQEWFLDRYARSRADFRGAYYLVNQMDGRSELSRDVKAALANVISDAALPAAVPWDESMREAHARRNLVYQRYPDSQTWATVKELAAPLAALVRGGDDPPFARK
jgi:cellulose synthase operon protein YhjQ